VRSHRLRVANAQGPNIVTDGLAFHVDAGNASSYSGSGYQVNSLVGSINNNNGTGYDGTISHTAVSGSNPAFFTYPSNVTFGQAYASSEFDIITYPNFSVDMWVRLGASGNASWGKVLGLKRHAYSVGSVGDTNASNTRLSSVFINASSSDNPSLSWFHYSAGNGNSGSGYNNAQITTPNLGTGGWLQNKWFHLAIVNDSYPAWSYGGYRRYYIDGVRVNSTQYGGPHYKDTRNPASPNNNGTFYLYLGGSEGTGGYQSRFVGDYSIYRFYKNKVLSDAEVAKNWNQQKALFGR